MITAAWQSYARSRAQAMDPGPGTNEWIRRGNRIDRKEPFGRVLSGLAAILTVLVSLCGCKDSSDTEQSNDAPFAREQINVFVPAGFELQERWRPIADEWSIRTEAAASVREYESGGRGPRADDAVVPTDAHLLVLPITQMANLAAFEIIQSLPDEALSESELNWYDIINGLRNAACSWRGQPTIVPISSPVFVCCYRRDLLESARLHPPETWQDYQKLLDTIDTWAPGEYVHRTQSRVRRLAGKLLAVLRHSNRRTADSLARIRTRAFRGTHGT